MRKKFHINWEKASWIAGVASAIIAFAVLVHEELAPASKPAAGISQVAGDGSTQIGNVFGTVVVSPPKPDEKGSHVADDITYRGVSDAFVAYHKTGMTGILLEVEDCYREVRKNSEDDDIKECFAIDLAGFYLDQQMAKFAEWRPNQNFTEAKVLERLNAALEKIGWNNKVQHKIVFETWVPQIKKDYEEIASRDTVDSK